MVAPAATARPLTPAQRAWIRALDRAKSVATRKPTFNTGTGTYRVFSPRAQGEYTITPTQQGRRVEYACTCTAQARGLVCWHKALVAACPIRWPAATGPRLAPAAGPAPALRWPKTGTSAPAALWQPSMRTLRPPRR